MSKQRRAKSKEPMKPTLDEVLASPGGKHLIATYTGAGAFTLAKAPVSDSTTTIQRDLVLERGVPQVVPKFWYADGEADPNLAKLPDVEYTWSDRRPGESSNAGEWDLPAGVAVPNNLKMTIAEYMINEPDEEKGLPRITGWPREPVRESTHLKSEQARIDYLHRAYSAYLKVFVEFERRHKARKRLLEAARIAAKEIESEVAKWRSANRLSHWVMNENEEAEK